MSGFVISKETPNDGREGIGNAILNDLLSILLAHSGSKHSTPRLECI